MPHYVKPKPYPAGRVYVRKPSENGGWASLTPLYVLAALVAILAWVVRRGKRR